jgi:hypothetical protein
VPGLGDLFGKNGILEQLLLWGVVNQVVSALGSPAFAVLTQDILAKNPDLVLTPEVLASAAARHLISEATAHTEATKSGIDSGRMDTLLALAKVRIAPADLAEAVLRSYLTHGEAEAQALPQGITGEQLTILEDLAGDAPGADQLAQALRRGIIDHHGKGAASTSFDQGIAETRLHNKWGPVLERLSAALLSPPDAASAVVRHFLPDHEAEAIAARSGVDAATFATMVHLSGDAPGPQQLAEALRRGAIPERGTGAGSVSFDQGIAEGRLADKWAPVIKALAKLWPTPVDALDAALKGQVSPEQGKDLYELLGGDLQFYDWLLHSQGEGPTPLEATVMANRGFIPWDGIGPNVTSFAQAVHESRFRDKWAPAYKDFAKYLPAEGTVVTLLSHNAITADVAADALAQHGMTQAQITAFLDEAHTEALSEYRGLTVTTALAAYHDQIISPADATTILEALHVTPGAVHLLLAYTDIQRSFAAVGNAVTRTRTLFANRKITAATAHQSLIRLGIPAGQIDGILAAWEVENSITVKVLTEAQIVDAAQIGVFTTDEAMTELGNIGYTPFDAWALLSIKAKAPLPNKPAPGPAPPQAQVIPGTT